MRQHEHVNALNLTLRSICKLAVDRNGGEKKMPGRGGHWMHLSQGEYIETWEWSKWSEWWSGCGGRHNRTPTSWKSANLFRRHSPFLLHLLPSHRVSLGSFGCLLQLHNCSLIPSGLPYHNCIRGPSSNTPLSLSLVSLSHSLSLHRFSDRETSSPPNEETID